MLKLVDISLSGQLCLYGTLHKADPARKPLVVIAHGYFSSNRIGPHRLYYQIAETLRSKGYNVVRFDLRGVGESDGDIKDVKFYDHVGDLTMVINEFRQRFNDPPIILIAHCIGCNISLPIISGNLPLFRKAVFISPYFTTDSTLSAFFGTEEKEELTTRGFTYRKGVYADNSFFSGQNLFHEFVQSLKKIGNIVSVISAKKDQYISGEETLQFYDQLGQMPILIANADHNYLDRQARADLIAKIADIIEGAN
jgi:pimeloyl-ACP methyl ester carboxylesterase